MKKFLTVCSAALFLVACNSSETKENKTDSASATTATETKKEDAWVPVDSATQMKAMIEYGTPGKMHEMLASWNGTWNGETTIWPAAGAPPMKSTGTAVNSMALGGRYQMSKHSGNMMGMPFEGIAITAYDNAQKKFVSSWIDNMSTGIMNMTGTWDETTKSMNMSGTMPDICRPGKECTFREVFTIVDENTQNMEMYGPDPATGKEYKMMEIKMTRKK
jgi:hypothetical protein